MIEITTDVFTAVVVEEQTKQKHPNQTPSLLDKLYWNPIGNRLETFVSQSNDNVYIEKCLDFLPNLLVKHCDLFTAEQLEMKNIVDQAIAEEIAEIKLLEDDDEQVLNDKAIQVDDASPEEDKDLISVQQAGGVAASNSTRLNELADALDSKTGGLLKSVFSAVRDQYQSPFLDSPTLKNEVENDPSNESQSENFSCDFCGQKNRSNHGTRSHICHICQQIGDHCSSVCPLREDKNSNFLNDALELLKSRLYNHQYYSFYSPSSSSSAACSKSLALLSPTILDNNVTENADSDVLFCTFCEKETSSHTSSSHICRICKTTGQHSSKYCESAKNANPSNVSKSSRLRASANVLMQDNRFYQKIVQVQKNIKNQAMYTKNPVESISSLLRFGLWNNAGGSQTPVTTPQIQHQNSAGLNDSSPSTYGSYVLSYAEGHSLVPARILKYMRLLMHSNVSTNAFHVAVKYDHLSSNWELSRPGMISPGSIPPTPRMRSFHQERMDRYTNALLVGVTDKLLKLQVV